MNDVPLPNKCAEIDSDQMKALYENYQDYTTRLINSENIQINC